jgi:hypothetical protein
MSWENQYNLGTRTPIGEYYQSGIAYVIIPSDVDRAKYIRECYKTSTISIYSEFNGVSNRVPIDKYSFNFVKFPNEIGQYGSAIKYSIDSVHNKPIIDGLYFKADEISDLVEHQFKFKREFNGNIVEIVGSPDDKYLGINVGADKEGEVYINVKSKDESGKVNINVEGECNITSLQNTTLKQYGKLSFVTANKDNDEESTVEEHTSKSRTIITEEENIITDKFNINNGNQNFVLGKNLKEFLDDLITDIGNITTTTSIGQQPILNKETILGYKKKTEALLSSIGFIDK